MKRAEQIDAIRPDGDGLQEEVGDKGYRSNQSLVDLEAVGVRSYISEPDRGRRSWKTHPEARDAVYRNRQRVRGGRGQRLLRLRGERLERPFAHLYETGGMRRVHLRGHMNIRKRLLIHTAGFNLGLLMRQLIGVGTPRGLQGRLIAVMTTLLTLIRPLWDLVTRHQRPARPTSPLEPRSVARYVIAHDGASEIASTTMVLLGRSRGGRPGPDGARAAHGARVPARCRCGRRRPRVVAPRIAGMPGGACDAGMLATVRTAVVSIAVVALALARRTRRAVELGWLLYPVLVAGGLKLLAEDLRYSRASTLFVALALYGGALIVAPRLARTAGPLGRDARTSAPAQHV